MNEKPQLEREEVLLVVLVALLVVGASWFALGKGEPGRPSPTPPRIAAEP